MKPIDAMLAGDISPRDLHRIMNGGIWVHLGTTEQGPVYACGNCYRQRYTLVTPGAKLPERCPMCGEENAQR